MVLLSNFRGHPSTPGGHAHPPRELAQGNARARTQMLQLHGIKCAPEQNRCLHKNENKSHKTAESRRFCSDCAPASTCLPAAPRWPRTPAAPPRRLPGPDLVTRLGYDVGSVPPFFWLLPTDLSNVPVRLKHTGASFGPAKSAPVHFTEATVWD